MFPACQQKKSEKKKLKIFHKSTSEKLLLDCCNKIVKKLKKVCKTEFDLSRTTLRILRRNTLSKLTFSIRLKVKFQTLCKI